jgi:hypothetical protein
VAFLNVVELECLLRSLTKGGFVTEYAPFNIGIVGLFEVVFSFIDELLYFLFCLPCLFEFNESLDVQFVAFAFLVLALGIGVVLVETAVDRRLRVSFIMGCGAEGEILAADLHLWDGE